VSSSVGPRRPFGKDGHFFDYDYDSDDDWEEEEQVKTTLFMQLGFYRESSNRQKVLLNTDLLKIRHCGMNDGISASCENVSSATLKSCR
jgi:Chromatin assembly factor 1 subunit A